MIYSIENKDRYEKDISVLCSDFHDSICATFNYDRSNKEIEIYMDNYYDKVRYHWKFSGIKLFFSADFDVWGYSGERLHEFNTVDVKSLLPSLNNLQTLNYENSRKKLADSLENLIGLHFLFVSGNEIFIVCERISITPDLV